jgi:hypothetical protein
VIARSALTSLALAQAEPTFGEHEQAREREHERRKRAMHVRAVGFGLRARSLRNGARAQIALLERCAHDERATLDPRVGRVFVCRTNPVRTDLVGGAIAHVRNITFGFEALCRARG